MRGVPESDPACIHSAEELEQEITRLGFLPLFAGEVPGFSVEERTVPENWWTDDPGTDPWVWREILARRGNVAYGKFFHNRAGFLSKEWLPVFANYRRDGYDFDARWDDELASWRQKKIMDLFMEKNADREFFSFEVKEKAGFGKNGEKNFEGTLTSLQMMLYLVCCDFRQKKNKKGQEYGWHIAVYSTPEHLFGRDLVTSCYREDPKRSLGRIIAQVQKICPGTDPRAVLSLVGYAEDLPHGKKETLPYPKNLFHALDPDRSPESWTKDEESGLYVALSQLRPKHQRVLYEKYAEGRKNEEIGAGMNRAAGTISSYHREALERLRDPLIAAWYRNGYQKNVRACAWGEHWNFPVPDTGEEMEDRDLALRVGIKVRHFESMAAAGVITVGDLKRSVSEDPRWYRSIHGIGPKTAEDIRKKMERFGLTAKEKKPEGDDDW